MTTQRTLLAFAGSFRSGSLSHALLKGYDGALPPTWTLKLCDYRSVPLYNGDVDGGPAVEAVKTAITEADALVFSAPEYNYSIPGVLKNMIDWASRPAYKSPLSGHRAGLMTLSGGVSGGARAQQHLKTILLGTATAIYTAPEMLIPNAASAFEGGVLTDEKVRAQVERYLCGLCEWAER